MKASAIKEDGAQTEESELPLAAPEKAVRAIQDMIRRKALVPGQQLPAQRDLAEKLQVSRASLREALSTLEALGFVRTEQGRGSFVTDGAPAGSSVTEWRFSNLYTLNEVYEFRYLTEPVAVRLAAMHISDDDISRLAELHERYKVATQTLDLMSSTHHDFEFHRIIMTSSGNRVFVDLYDKFNKIFQETQMLPFSKHERRWEPVLEHEKILTALQRRDPDGAAYYMSIHLVRATERIGVKLNHLV
jgi:GntR family transcriptional repressor for pyruvate dehydrogenase complex